MPDIDVVPDESRTDIEEVCSVLKIFSLIWLTLAVAMVFGWLHHPLPRDRAALVVTWVVDLAISGVWMISEFKAVGKSSAHWYSYYYSLIVVVFTFVVTIGLIAIRW